MCPGKRREGGGSASHPGCPPAGSVSAEGDPSPEEHADCIDAVHEMVLPVQSRPWGGLAAWSEKAPLIPGPVRYNLRSVLPTGLPFLHVQSEGSAGCALEGSMRNKLCVFSRDVYSAGSQNFSFLFSSCPALSTHVESFRARGWPRSLDVPMSQEARVLPNLPMCFLSCRTQWSSLLERPWVSDPKSRGLP